MKILRTLFQIKALTKAINKRNDIETQIASLEDTLKESDLIKVLSGLVNPKEQQSEQVNTPEAAPKVNAQQPLSYRVTQCAKPSVTTPIDEEDVLLNIDSPNDYLFEHPPAESTAIPTQSTSVTQPVVKVDTDIQDNVKAEPTPITEPMSMNINTQFPCKVQRIDRDSERIFLSTQKDDIDELFDIELLPDECTGITEGDDIIFTIYEDNTFEIAKAQNTEKNVA